MGWKTWCSLIIPNHRVWKLGVSWLQGLKTRGFPIARLIYSFLWDFPNDRVHPIVFLFHDQNWFFIIITTMLLSFFHHLAGPHYGFSCNNLKICANCFFFLRLDDMHASLPDLKYRFPPLWCTIVIGCPCLYPKAFFVLPMHWLIHVLAIHSAVNAVPILGCLWQLLLASFIKLDPAPMCGVARFILKKICSSSIFSQELSFDWLCVPTPIKIANQSWTCLQSKQYSSSTRYH